MQARLTSTDLSFSGADDDINSVGLMELKLTAFMFPPAVGN